MKSTVKRSNTNTQTSTNRNNNKQRQRNRFSLPIAIGRDSDIEKIPGMNGDDVVSIRTSTGKSTFTMTGSGEDSVILYGSDEIPTGNYHQMLGNLKKSPVKTANRYFGSRHTVSLGSGKEDGADTLSLVSELGATPEVMLKHTDANGRVNGKGVAGENNKAYDHWAGVFGFVNIVDFDPTEDTVNLAGHTTRLGESFSKNGDFFQTVYSEQNVNDQSGPRAGAAHDDTFLGLLRFQNGADSAEAIANALDVDGMENFVVNGIGQQVFDGDPTANRSNDSITSDPLMTFSLVNSKTEKVVKGFENLSNGSEIDLSGLNLEEYSVVANINPDHFYADLVESVKFESNLGNRVENIKPYALFGDNTQGDYWGKAPEDGKVMIKATAYSKDGGKGKAIASTNLDYTITNSEPVPMPGKTIALGTDSTMRQVMGSKGDDVVSIRTSTGNSTMTRARGGSDNVILYGADEIPTGNYHDMLKDLKAKPGRTASKYFGARHTVNLGADKNGGSDTLSLISELGGTPEVIKKHTQDDGRINGKGVAGENNQAYDHWAGVFGFVNIVNFDPTEDTLNLAGHTTRLGESFTKNGDFFQTVYSEQNANDQSGPRAGAAHDDTFLGLLQFRKGAASAKDISKAIKVDGMRNFVVDGTGKDVFEGDPTGNRTGNVKSSGSGMGSGSPSGAMDLSGLEAYGGSGQNKAFSQRLSNKNTAVRMKGNGWRKLGVNYTITPDTRLSFEFRSNSEGEIHSIGFDNDNKIGGGDRAKAFQLLGTQDWGQGKVDAYKMASDWKSFNIPVGEYFTGKQTFLTFGNDHDVMNPTAMSEFRNVKLYEADSAMGMGTKSAFAESEFNPKSDLTAAASMPNYAMSETANMM